jgi:hypothetical protein
MSLEVKNLANGLLPKPPENPPGTPVDPPGDMNPIYLAPRNGVGEATASKAAVVKTIRLLNTHTQPVAMKLWFVPYTEDEGTYDPEQRRPVLPKGMSLEPGQMLIEEAELTLSPGDAIFGSASYAAGGWTGNPPSEPAGIEYVISGAEREVL